MKQIKLNDMGIECILFNQTKSMAMFTRSELKNHIIMIISDPKIDTHKKEVSNIVEPCLFHKLWQNRHPRWWFWVTLNTEFKKRETNSKVGPNCCLFVSCCARVKRQRSQFELIYLICIFCVDEKSSLRCVKKRRWVMMRWQIIRFPQMIRTKCLARKKASNIQMKMSAGVMCQSR